jgi:YVTN family beta-propeller protein
MSPRSRRNRGPLPRRGPAALLLVLLVVLLLATLPLPVSTPEAPNSVPTALSQPALRIAPSPPLSGPPQPFSVESTTVLANNTTLPGNFLASNGVAPDAVAYDPAASTLWVANGVSGTVSIINLTLGRMVEALPVGSDPTALLYDPANQRIFVVNQYSNNVTVINASRLSVIGSVPVGLAPTAIALDSSIPALFVVNSNFSYQDTIVNHTVYNGSLTEVNPNSLHIVANLTMPLYPTDALYGPDGHLYVVSAEVNTTLNACEIVTVDPTTGTILRTIPLISGECGFPIPPANCVNPPLAVNPFPGFESLAYDPTNGFLYVAGTSTLHSCNYTNSIAALDLSTNSWVVNRTVPFGPTPLGISSIAQITYDPAIPAILADLIGNGSTGAFVSLNPQTLATTGNWTLPGAPMGLTYSHNLSALLWTDANTARVTVASPSSLHPTLRFLVGTYPIADLALPPLHAVAIALYYQNEVMLTNASTGAITARWPVGSYPTALAYDPFNDYLAVANFGSANLTVLNASNGHTVANIPAGGAPEAVTFDSAHNAWWISNSPNGSVTEVLASTDATLRVVSVDPGAILGAISADNATDAVAVAILTNATLAVLNASSGAIEALVPVGLAPEAIAPVPTTDSIYVANAASGNVSVVNATTLNVTSSIPTPNLPLGLAYDSAQGVVLVVQSGANAVDILSVLHETVVGAVEVGSSPSGIALDPTTGTAFVTSVGSGTLSALGTVGYDVTVAETGLPSNSTWWFNLTATASYSTSSSHLTFRLINGTYAYTTATSAPGFSGPSGVLLIQGRPTNLTVSFALVKAEVSFDAVGLPPGTRWFVNLSNGFAHSSTSDLLTFNLTDGFYQYTVASANRSYAPNHGSGSFTVQGSLLAFEIQFTGYPSPVSFHEFGLPNGTEWWVRTGGGQFTTSHTVMVIGFLNGTYAYTTGTANSSYQGPQGSFRVDGSLVSVNLTYRLLVYPVTFAESGLANGTLWSIDIHHQRISSSNATLVVNLPNGSYSFSISPPPGYSASPTSGSLSVSGSSVDQAVAFTATSPGISSRTYWIAGIAVGAFAAGTVAFLIARRRRLTEP